MYWPRWLVLCWQACSLPASGETGAPIACHATEKAVCGAAVVDRRRKMLWGLLPILIYLSVYPEKEICPMKIQLMIAALVLSAAAGSVLADPAADFTAASKSRSKLISKAASAACKKAPKTERKACDSKAKDRQDSGAGCQQQMDAARHALNAAR